MNIQSAQQALVYRKDLICFLRIICVCVCFLRLGFLFSCNVIMFNFQVKLKEMGSDFH